MSTLALLLTQVGSRRTAPPDRPLTRLELTLPSGVEPYIGPSAVAFSPDGTRVRVRRNRGWQSSSLRASPRRVRNRPGPRNGRRNGNLFFAGWPFDRFHLDGSNDEEECRWMTVSWTRSHLRWTTRPEEPGGRTTASRLVAGASSGRCRVRRRRDTVDDAGRAKRASCYTHFRR